MRASIVIPAYRPVALLEGCLNGIINNTKLSEVEVIVVCNGSDRESAELVISLGTPFRLVWVTEALGFTKATNIGLKLATSEFVVVLNTDAHILPYQAQGVWLDRLLRPFEDAKIGITGLGLMWTSIGYFAPFYCAGIRRSLFDQLGYLDERFSPGYCEDADFCYRARAAGYETVQIDHATPVPDNSRTVTDYPIWHPGEQSFPDKEKRMEHVQRGQALLHEKWGHK